MLDEEYKACKVLLTVCSDCKKDEKLLFVTDPTSYEVAQKMWEAAADFPNKSIILMNERNMHGQDPNDMVAAAMAAADVIFGVTKFSLFHSNARRKAVAGGSRFINMVDYRVSMFETGGLFADFIKQEKFFYVDEDPDIGKRLFFDNAGGAFRLKAAVERFAEIDAIPDCPERIHKMALRLQQIQKDGISDSKLISSLSATPFSMRLTV